MTARLISSATLWHLHVTQGRSEDLCAWVRANGIDPDLVPIEHDLTIEDTPTGSPSGTGPTSQRRVARSSSTRTGPASR